MKLAQISPPDLIAQPQSSPRPELDMVPNPKSPRIISPELRLPSQITEIKSLHTDASPLRNMILWIMIIL